MGAELINFAALAMNGSVSNAALLCRKLHIKVAK
jgi:hypothetical protein